MGQLLDTLAAATPPERVAALATLLGDTPAATGSALAAVLPTMLAALGTRAEHGAMDQVMALVPRMLEGGNPLDQLAAFATDTDARTTLMAHGRLMADHLLGGQAAPIGSALSALSGARPDTVTSLLALAGPLAAGALARASAGHPTADGIAGLLAAETPAIRAALPPGFPALVAPLAAEATPLHGTSAEGAAGAALSAGRWLPWLLAAVAAIAVIASLRSFQARDIPNQMAAPVAPTAIITEAPDTREPVTLPDGSTLSLQPGTAAFELARWLQGSEKPPRAFRFETLAYDSGGQRLDAAGQAAVRSIAAVLAAYPSVQARIEGHTDSEGDDAANLELSRARAAGIAALLEQNGIAPDRISSEGLGESRPIATNDTAEGRAQNRRTVLVVTAR